MKTESKYYTPSIEEFHVGFEYEILSNERFQEDDGDWNSFVFGSDNDVYDFNMSDWPEALKYHIEENQIRVKRLDLEDCLELGLKKKVWEESSNGGYFIIGDFTIGINTVGIFCMISQNDHGNNIVRFSGELKNKSELKRLMRQLVTP